ncbi:hypothetical protein ABIE06_003396 [Pantoea dispersa]|uniref:cellulase family glycosylhydrolase n=1 Tax=Pantoea dispersa TaxID=59814 RepID=UPI003D1D0BA3
MRFGKVFVLMSLLIFILPSRSDAFTLGINVRVYNLDKKTIANYLDMIKSMGVDSIRVDMPWKVVEKQRNHLQIPTNWDYFVDYANSHGMEVLCILDYGNKFYDDGDKPRSKEAVIAFVRYVDFLTKHFSNKIKFYQVWNEWNGKVGNTTPGSIDDYKNLVRASYPVIKENAPDSIVITGSFSSAAFNKAIGLENKGDYLRDYLSPEMAKFTDAISVHPYTTYRKHPFDEYSYYLKQARYAYALVKNNPFFKDKKVFITEIGWSTSITSYGVPMKVQSKLLANAVCDAKKIGYSGVFLYSFKDSKTYSNNTEDGFGLFNDNLTPKESVSTISNMSCL